MDTALALGTSVAIVLVTEVQ